VIRDGCCHASSRIVLKLLAGFGRRSNGDENGNRTQYGYDSMNRLVRTTLADGSISRLTYDARGNILTSVDPL
jgi:YD repeat-containing protein